MSISILQFFNLQPHEWIILHLHHFLQTSYSTQQYQHVKFCVAVSFVCFGLSIIWLVLACLPVLTVYIHCTLSVADNCHTQNLVSGDKDICPLVKLFSFLLQNVL